MAPHRQRCPGCFQDFASSTAIQNHITQSRNPACRIAYDALIEASLAHDEDFDMHSEDIIGEPDDDSIFAGDFFGDYQVNDFPGLNNNDKMEPEFTANADNDDVSVNSDIADLDYEESDDEDYPNGNNADLYEEANHEPIVLEYVYHFIIEYYSNMNTIAILKNLSQIQMQKLKLI